MTGVAARESGTSGRAVVTSTAALETERHDEMEDLRWDQLPSAASNSRLPEPEGAPPAKS